MQPASPQKTGLMLKVCIPVTNAQTKHHLLTMVLEEYASCFSFTAFPAQPFCLWR